MIKSDLLLSLSLWMLASPPTEIASAVGRSSPVNPVSIIERLSSIVPFIDCPIALEGERRTPTSFVVASDTAKCVIVDQVSKPSQVRAVSSVISGRKKLRVIIEVPLSYNFDKELSIIVVRIIGGPAGDITPSYLDDMYEQTISNNGLLITLAYSGTQFNSAYPRPDEDLAIDELSDICSDLGKTRLPAKIVFAGESLGASLVVKASKGQCGSVINKIVLISPPLITPRQMVNHFISKMKDLNIDDPMRHIETSSLIGTSQERRWVSVHSVPLFRAFFGPDQMDRDPLPDIRSIKPIPTLMVIGNRDDIIGIGKIESLRRPPNSLSIEQVDMDHSPDRLQIFGLSQKIANFIGVSTKAPGNAEDASQ